MPCPPTRFPRTDVAASFGEAVKGARKTKKWTRTGLARRVGVTRQTIIRLEAGRTKPGVQLVRALTHPSVFGPLPGLDWDLPARDALPWGFLARLARRGSGQKLRQVAEKAGCSTATLTDFERHVLYDPKILGIRHDRVGERYATALGFEDSDDMFAFLVARDATPWLDRIAAKFNQPRLANALRPSLRPAEPVLEIDLNT
ncbi:helix-turn-helix transcriptional regulator [Sphingomonas baiyangensis]|uniref:Helix-turn-helix transcriptional regulator n=1 Tax=Sphingomonas baiyangensis TaxID=2572576 RepID=A0A4U1L3D1_9SPHN|nr:helix-turn-helix transcriptional regulator [Sphingomonas baiyangensis]